jgi:response regulator RpfG family c-di-GMP phosphodiesterase
MGLRGEAIPGAARIFAVADAMDAITSGRPYKEKQGWEEVDAALREGSGKQFDPRAVRAYFHLPRERWESLRQEVERQTVQRLPPSLQELTASLRESRESAGVSSGGFQRPASADRALPMKMLHGIVAGIESADKPSAERSRVLVVDDEEMMCRLLRTTLEGEGYVVDVAHTPEQAIETLGTRRYDLAVLDYLMQRGDSRALFERVCTLQPQLAKRLLFISGAPLEGGLAQFLTRVRAPFLRKPFEPEELISALRVLDRPLA